MIQDHLIDSFGFLEILDRNALQGKCTAAIHMLPSLPRNRGWQSSMKLQKCCHNVVLLLRVYIHTRKGE